MHADPRRVIGGYEDAGSYGTANLPEIVRSVVEELWDCTYDSFVFPAIGSHGAPPRMASETNLPYSA